MRTLKGKLKKKKALLLTLIFLIHLIFIFLLILILGLSESSDSHHYYLLAQNKNAGKPFHNRILIPFIVSFFPIEFHKWVFDIIIIISMASISVIIFLFLESHEYKFETCLFGLIIYMGSFFFQLNSLAMGQVDAPFFLCIMLLLLFVNKEKTSYSALMFIIAFFIKETALFFIPIILIESFFKKKKILFSTIIIISIPIIFIYLYRNPGSGVSFEFFIQLLNYHNIFLEQGIFLAFLKFVILIIGYALYIFGIIFFFVLFGFLKTNNKDKLKFLILCIEVLLTFFLAYDWSRMMFLLFPLVIVLGSKPFDELMIRNAFKNRNMLLILILISFIWIIIYSITWIFYDLFYDSSLKIIVYFLISLPLPLIYLIYMKKNTDLSIISIISKEIEITLLTLQNSRNNS